MAYLLGIDIGTSGTKTVLFDEAGNTITSALEEYPLYQPKVGWAEQDAGDWWQAAVLSIRKVLAESGVKPADIGGIGLSGQMHSLVMLDGENRIIRRSINWSDQRSTAECEQMTSIIGPERLVEITANPALTGFTASKILWVKNNEPGNFDKCKKILHPKDYIRFLLSGEFATEVSDASGMQLLDVPGRCWSGEMLQKLGIDRSQLAEVYESQVVSSRVSRAAAEMTGLSEGTPIVGGGGDNAASAVGNGIVKPGVASSSIGTSGVVFASLDQFRVDPRGRVHTFCHAIPGTWHVMGVVQSAGLSLKWFRDNFCRSELETAALMESSSYALLDMEAEKVCAGSNGLLYLPYLMGERTPHLDAFAKGVFLGLSAKHDRKDMIRAIMEGVVYGLRDCMEIIEGMGVNVESVIATGGGVNSRLWKQIQADVYGKGITTLNSSEGPALGAALLAGIGTGVYRDVAQACEATVKAREVQQPDMELHEKYSMFYKVYGQLYRSLKKDYIDLAETMKDVYGQMA